MTICVGLHFICLTFLAFSDATFEIRFIWVTIFNQLIDLNSLWNLKKFCRTTFLQITAFRYWSSRTSTGPTSSTVRGQSLKSDSTTRQATTGLTTSYYTSWHRTAATSWGLICSQVEHGTGPSTVRSLCCVICTATSCRCPGTRVTLVMGSPDTTIWCSPRMTVTTTDGATLPTTTTVLCTTAADSGTTGAPMLASTLSAVVVTTSDGIRRRPNIFPCRHHACGWRARSLHWLSRWLWFTVVTTSKSIKRFLKINGNISSC